MTLPSGTGGNRVKAATAGLGIMLGMEWVGKEQWMQQRIAEDEIGCAVGRFGAVPQFCVPCQYSDGDISRLGSEGRNSGTKPVRTAVIGV